MGFVYQQHSESSVPESWWQYVLCMFERPLSFDFNRSECVLYINTLHLCTCYIHREICQMHFTTLYYSLQGVQKVVWTYMYATNRAHHKTLDFVSYNCIRSWLWVNSTPTSMWLNNRVIRNLAKAYLQEEVRLSKAKSWVE